MRTATAEDLFGVMPLKSLLKWEPDRNHHGKRHPDVEIDSVYFSIHSEAGTLSGGVDPWLYRRLSADYGIEYIEPWGEKDPEYRAKLHARLDAQP